MTEFIVCNLPQDQKKPRDLGHVPNLTFHLQQIKYNFKIEFNPTHVIFTATHQWNARHYEAELQANMGQHISPKIFLLYA